jgi:hypothetical protein
MISKNHMKKILSISFVLTLLLVPALFINAQTETVSPTIRNNRMENREVRMENREAKIASTTIRMENRQARIASTTLRMEEMRARMASSTLRKENRMASTSERVTRRVAKMNEVRERLSNKEFKVISVLEQIAEKIQSRINILTGKGLDMSAAEAKLALATENITKMTTKAAEITTDLETEITEENMQNLGQTIKSAQEIIRDMAKETHTLLVDTIKEITEVLPTQSKTASSTNQ